MTTLFVGNLSPVTTAADLTELFARHGEVASVSVPVDGNSGRNRGFALVDMASGVEAAVKAVHGAVVCGRRLAVNSARPRPAPVRKLT